MALVTSQAMAAARAGKAILLEKPMGLNQAELDELAAVLEETGVPFMVGYNRRFSPYAVEARRHTDRRLNPLFMRYRMNAGYIPLDHWVHGPEGGGRIAGEACHIVDLFNSFTGAKAAAVRASRLMPRTGSISADDNASIAISYAYGSVGVLDYFAVGSRQLPKEQLEVHFDEKSILIDDYRALRGYGLKVDELKGAAGDKGHLQELAEFQRAMTTGTLPIPLWDLRQSAEISIQAQGSFSAGTRQA